MSENSVAIDFTELIKHIPIGGSLALTVKRCDGSIVSSSDTEDGKETENQAKEDAAGELDLVVAATIFFKAGESTPVTLRGASADLSAHFFEHFTGQVEKMSVLQQMEKQTKELDQKISKEENALKSKNNKLATVKAKGPQKDESKTAEKKEEKKETHKEVKKPVVSCIDLFGDSALSGNASQENAADSEENKEVAA